MFQNVVLCITANLGVKFNPTLKFSEYAAMVANRANRMVGIIRSTFDFLEEGMLKTLFKTLVRPHLEYGNCIWSPFLQKDIMHIHGLK